MRNRTAEPAGVNEKGQAAGNAPLHREDWKRDCSNCRPKRHIDVDCEQLESTSPSMTKKFRMAYNRRNKFNKEINRCWSNTALILLVRCKIV